MKPGLLVASLVLIGSTAFACGGDSGESGGESVASGEAGAPTNANQDDFCAVQRSLYENLTTLLQSSNKDFIASVKDYSASLQETGTPSDVPDSARSGFETTVTMMDDLDADATRADFENIDADLSEEEKTQIAEFETYTTNTCGSPIEGMTPSETPAA